MKLKLEKEVRFVGISLIEEPIIIAGFLEGEYAKAVYDRFRERVAELGNPKILEDAIQLSHHPGSSYPIVEGSHPFALPVINGIVKRDGLRIAGLDEYKRIWESKNLYHTGIIRFFDKHYVNSALVLISLDKPEEYHAKNLYHQLEQTGRKPLLPIIIPYSELLVEKDRRAPEGISFRLLGLANEVVHAPELLKENSIPGIIERSKRRFDIFENSGLCDLSLRGICESGQYSLKYDVMFELIRFQDSARNGRVILTGNISPGSEIRR